MFEVRGILFLAILGFWFAGEIVLAVLSAVIFVSLNVEQSQDGSRIEPQAEMIRTF